jgi:UDP-N-acetylmuramoyl-L-alanyl-D-glutamate--2,6-diaminopimelate ligase
LAKTCSSRLTGQKRLGKPLAWQKKGDIVLLLGKGHENSIIYKDRAMPYDEIAEAKKALAELGYNKEV